MPPMIQTQALLSAQQQAIQSLQADLARASLRANAGPLPRIPHSAAPEKCELEMSSSAFRSWKRSMSCWLQLCKWPQMDAVHHVRLHCVPALQRALDAKFTDAQWRTLTPDAALDAIGKIVLRSSNQAVQWLEFFSVVQGQEESISDYFIKCTQKATDCEFKCPNCAFDLSEFMLLRKLMVGLSDQVLKRQVFQMCDVFKSVDALRAMCCTFEAARRDASGGKSWREVPHAAGTDAVDDASLDTAAASKSSTATPTSRTCGNCGGRHAPDRASCPARSLTCHGCQKVGHMKKCCRSMKKGMNGQTASLDSLGAVVIAEARHTPQPTIKVVVTHASGSDGAQMSAVADTGAQVCVAGPALLSSINLRPALLQRRAGLRDVADLPLKCMGSAPCHIKCGERSTVQDVYFMKTAKRFYISLKACKELGLVSETFPHQPTSVASVGVEVFTPTASLPHKPLAVPLPPLEENVPRLEKWLLQHFSASTFNTAREPLPVMEGKPHHIHLAREAVPYACHTPASVPKHWEKEVKDQLDEDIRRGVLQAVPAGEATEWCSRMVVVAKKSGQPRRTVDYQKLNAGCLRETHHTQAPFDMVSGVPLHSFKTVADAYWGFHQVELDEESRRLTTFITPWGRYQYRRTPMGHCSASDAYTRRFDDAIQDVPRKYKCVDDTLLYDSSIEEAFWHTYDFLVTCAKKGITLKPEKFQFCRREVDFVGFHLGWDSYKPTENSLAAIRSFPMPAKPTISDIRSWYGFVNQLAPFIATAPIMAPFRDLLKKQAGKHVYWDDQLKEKFQLAQDAICQLAKDGLVYYDKTRPTVAITDWSKEGLGFVILQQYCSCSSTEYPFCCKGGWRIALCGSRHLTPAEAGYAAVEGEALAVVWCLKKARLFLLGCPNLTVITDHRPLVKLLGDKALGDVVNPRLFRLKEKTLQFKFVIKYLPGKRNCAADFLSRFPALRMSPDEVDNELDEDLSIAVVSATIEALERDGHIMDEENVKRAAMDDPVYQLLMAKVLAGDWHPQKSQEIACLRQFYSIKDRLAVAGDLLTYTHDQGCVRLVIPDGLRQQVAANLHAGHQGLDSMLRRARHAVYWPGMEGDLQYHRSTCTSCDVHAPSLPAEGMNLTPPPDYPFQCTVVDMFQMEGHMYMAYADRLTGWLEVAHFPNGTTSPKLMSQLRRYFTRWGAPEQISMDGGTNLVSEEMATFFRRWGASVRLSSAHYPQSNGRAEAAVKTAKRVIRANTGGGGSLDSDKASFAILQYLNTPLRGVDKSPAQLATGRQLRDGVPTARQHYKVDRHWRQALRNRELQMARIQEKFSSADTFRRLTPLQPGARVRIQNQASNRWDRTGVVTETLPHRQYTVKLDGSGRISLRNRRHLRLSGPPTPEASQTPTTTPPTPGVTPPPSRIAVPPPLALSRPKRAVAKPARLADYVL